MKLFRQSFVSAAVIAVAGPLLAGSDAPQTTYKTIQVDDVSIFYREAGSAANPTLLLLHGFPSSSHMFRDLIPALATKFHVIAPDYPGFGQSSAPDAASYDYSFGHLADTMDDFLSALDLEEYSLYMQDFGGPVGLRLALDHPERLDKLIIQNATFHVEGWNPDVVAQFAPFWAERNPDTEAPLRGFLAPETTRWQYLQGASDPALVSPDSWTSDQIGLDRPGNDAIQLEYLWNYQDNVAQYADWQSFLAKTQPETLIVWGENDPFFTKDGVSALTDLLPSAEVHLYDAGHFALETHAYEIADEILHFMAR